MSSALLYTLTHAHRHTPVSFSGRVRGLCWERDPPFPHLKDMKFVTVFPLCVSAWTWYSACVWFDACLQVFLFDFALVCASPEMEEGTILCVYLYICVRVCVYMCVCVFVPCVHAHAWLSGLSQTAQNSLQSDISPAGDKWWLDERERWGSARISVSLRSEERR